MPKSRFIMMHRKILDDPKIGLMNDHLFRRWIEMMLAFTEHEYTHHEDIAVEDAAWFIHTSPEKLSKDIENLRSLGLMGDYVDQYGYMVPFNPQYFYGVKADTKEPEFPHGLFDELLDPIPDDERLIRTYYTLLDIDGNTFYFMERVPESYGVYFFTDEDGKIIYIGSSINLRKRIPQSFKVRNQAKRVDSIAYYTTDDEECARLLESTMINKYHPILNVEEPKSFGFGSAIDAYSLDYEEVQTWQSNG